MGLLLVEKLNPHYMFLHLVALTPSTDHICMHWFLLRLAKTISNSISHTFHPCALAQGLEAVGIGGVCLTFDFLFLFFIFRKE